jgi:hypothetical protein
MDIRHIKGRFIAPARSLAPQLRHPDRASIDNGVRTMPMAIYGE